MAYILEWGPDELSAQSITLVSGTADEIGKALKELWAPPDIVAKSISFLVKIPGWEVRKMEGGFQIGNSFLPVSKTGVGKEIATTQSRFAGVLAANDARYSLVA